MASLGKVKWGATKSDSSEPYRTFDEALESVEIRFYKDSDFSTKETFQARKSPHELDIAVAISLQENDLNEIRASVRDPLIKVILRDRSILRFEEVLSMAASEPFSNQIFKIPSGISGHNEAPMLDIAVVIVDGEGQSVSDRTKSYATKLFKLRDRSQAEQIPRIWVTESQFVAKGLGPKTPWYLNWKSASVQQPLAEVVEVWLNQDLRSAFDRIANPRAGSSGELFQVTMTSQILTEIVCGVLIKASTEEAEGEQGSAIETIMSFAEQSLEFSRVELLGAAHDIDFHSKVRARAAEYYAYSTVFMGIGGE